mmetsp:Transcript_21884/g.59026  ORF Transcript_21884/g.59026 Transcript_21884/m.59026 type:complete len:306 (+) Transcript_21884:373-1290(+)
MPLSALALPEGSEPPPDMSLILAMLQHLSANPPLDALWDLDSLLLAILSSRGVTHPLSAMLSADARLRACAWLAQGLRNLPSPPAVSSTPTAWALASSLAARLPPPPPVDAAPPPYPPATLLGHAAANSGFALACAIGETDLSSLSSMTNPIIHESFHFLRSFLGRAALLRPQLPLRLGHRPHAARRAHPRRQAPRPVALRHDARAVQSPGRGCPVHPPPRHLRPGRHSRRRRRHRVGSAPGGRRLHGRHSRKHLTPRPPPTPPPAPTPTRPTQKKKKKKKTKKKKKKKCAHTHHPPVQGQGTKG